MDVRRLDLLRELSERGSVTAVAEATGRTPSAVSQQLKILEREAGMPLTQRSGRGVVLTSAGQALARSATDVAVALERASALWDEFRNHPSGEVTLLTFPTMGAAVLPGVLQEIAAIPGLVVRATDSDAELSEFADLTNDHDIVLAYTMPGELPWGGRGLAVIPLFTEPLDIGLPAGHRLAERAYVTADDVVDEEWLGVPSGYPFERLEHAVEQQAGRRVHVGQRFSDMRIVEAFIQAGLGIGFVPRYTSGTVPEGIVLKPVRGFVAVRQIVALVRPDVAERLAVRTVLDVLTAHAARLADQFSTRS
ncbi:LysR family transcriptional regulator [Agromyces aerolatus]|uniref:LysR family transcriptional regulator n=1 Tax=Agromyces sp. LY-1074 TaxID=3074080 RepID=UPI0028553284|nr:MULTISPECIES: LysR family transcriptional regulator [unclassified Agromyces]MDR5701175.1 LysR family transcriptional regulator [Agromyces sp. LY-1074]MDR5707815.1 LysR family transcriptional regulator [Agromyces sp. LY-1358]